MPRISRVVAIDMPHHITQRGNAQQAIFDSDADRSLYLDLLRRYSAHYELRLWSWCLMTNHIHLLGVPQRQNSMHYALNRTHAEYARYLNLKRRTCGHLWQSRFYSCPVGPDLTWITMAYIERNPTRAKLVRQAADYRWSSAYSHTSGVDPDRLIEWSPWSQNYSPERWAAVLESSVDDEAHELRLREATRRGRPFASDHTINQLEASLGRSLRPKAIGRPRKLATVVATAKA